MSSTTSNPDAPVTSPVAPLVPDTPVEAPVEAPAAAPALQTAVSELPLLPASPSALLGRTVSPRERPSLTDDRPASAMAFDDLVSRAVDGARQEGTGRSVARALIVVLGLVAALRIVFDDALPKLALAFVLGAALVLGAMIALRAAAEARRQRALLVALAHLSRVARLDPSMRDRVAPQIDAIVDALREPVSPWPSLPSWKDP